MRLLTKVAGTVLLLLGILGSAVALIGIADPVAAKMADDADPFGTPATLAESLSVLALYLAVAATGIYLLVRRRGVTSV